MSSPTPDSFDLSTLGWDAFRGAEFADHASAGLIPARVSRVDRGRCDVHTSLGPFRAATPAVVCEEGGVVTGTSKKDLLEMNYVPGSVDVQVGQPVFTTGQDGIFPPGLKIGEIVSVVTGSATTPHQIQIQPAAKLNSMQEVGVLLYEAPQKTEYEQKLPNAVKKK